MTPLQFIFILRARYKVAIAVALVGMALAVAIVLRMPLQYTATTSVLVDVRSPDLTASLVVPASLSTQLEIINSERVAQKVVKSLGLADSAVTRAQWMQQTQGMGTLETWLAQRLLRGLRVMPGRDSNIVSISYAAGDATSAAQVANAFAQAYIDVTVELKVEPARQYAIWFGEQGKALRAGLESAQAALSAYQQEKGIVSSDERYDTETLRLGELSTQLLRVQVETSDARNKQRSGMAADTLPDVMANAVVAGLRSEIAKQEAKLQETALNLGRNHPQYLRMQSEVAALKQTLQAEMRLLTSGYSVSREIGSNKESDLRRAIVVQKTRLLQLKNERDKMAALQRDVDAAKNAYDTVVKRQTETTLAGQARQADVSVLSPAMAPIVPSSKSLGNMLAIAVGFGLLLGLGAAYGLEKLDRRIRSVEDLSNELQLPVLGVISRPVQPSRRLAFWRQDVPLLGK